MINVVIPTCNDDQRLALVLWGLTQQTTQDFEVIVVNDGGEDDTKDIIDSYKDVLNIQYKYLYPKSIEYRPSKARNLGIENCTHQRIVFIDGDVIPSSKLIESHAQYSDTDWMIIGPRKRIKESALPHLYSMLKDGMITYYDIDKCVYVIDERLRLDKYKCGFNSLSRPIFDTFSYHNNLNFACMCHSMNISYPASIIRKLNNFSEEYDGMLHGEDHDLAIRFIKAGHSIVSIPDQYVYHLDHPPRAERNETALLTLLSQTRQKI